MNPLLLLSFFTAGTDILGGYQQQKAYEAEAQQSKLQAQEQEIERRKKLNRTLAMQNVMAAAQGRTVSSIAALQKADIAEAESGIKKVYQVSAAEQSQLRSAGRQAMLGGLLKGGSSFATGYKQSQLLKG